ncbi:conserved hypothetical protein [Ancylobacter novellus DSM 506]|uniref:Uncharacterized protein n=1 Tax=Ancylobacter novellus (strain ATCC 8093 / DSM 506 / JCM 20403 / CCM 1077 / IAM 12100 / NBRC 12443 / NCIMB 10456) TaxID=639283 RepID=D7A478_ANCN5|nr:hypothetical protein [Ancylobacter novellus]ADH87898.1 conserved hypothetical protein [Ancylobacter novellus DSM 506]
MAAGSTGLGMTGRWVAAIGIVALVGAAIGLWARHGAAVFFDMVAAGIAYCF